MFKTRTLGALGALALLTVPAYSQTTTITLRRDSVVPIVFNDSLSLRSNRAGERFTARVDNDRDLPRGTVLQGRIRSVREAQNNRPGYMDLEFTDIILPGARSQRINAIPVPINDRTVSRTSDGRLVATKDVRKGEQAVLAGALGGLVLGSLAKKPLEGAILGTVAGFVIAGTDRSNDGNTVVRSGQRMGALLERDARITFDTRGYDIRRDDRRDDRWDDRWDDRRDDRWDDRRDDRWDNRRDDRDWDRRNDRAPVVSISGREVRWGRDEQPYYQGDTLMVPLETTARSLGLRVDTGRYQTVYVEGREGTLRLERNSNEARVNGRTVRMARPMAERNRILFVPIEVLADVSRESVTVNGNRIVSRGY